MVGSRQANRSVGATSPYAAARHEDAAFFADWSAGNDAYGLWLWPCIQRRVIVIRPRNATMVNMVSRFGGKRQAWHRYDSSSGRDWHIPLSRWKEVYDALPQLIAARRKGILLSRLANMPDWETVRIKRGGQTCIITYSRPSRTFAAAARDLGAKFSGNLPDRAGWWIPVDHPHQADFVALCQLMARAAARGQRAAIISKGLI